MKCFSKRNRNRWIAAALAAVSMLAAVPMTGFAAFDDVSADYPFSQAISLLDIMDVAQGAGDGKFYPEEFVSRAEFVTMTVAAFSIETEGALPFEDVTEGSYYAEAVAKAVNAGIIRGKSAALFAPDDQVTHQEAATVLVNAYERVRGVKIPTSDAVESFEDAAEVDAWAKTIMDKAATYRFVPVGEENALRPDNSVTRGEAAQLISNALLALGEPKDDDFSTPTEFIQTKLGNVFVRSDSVDLIVSTGCRLFGWEVRGFYGDILKKGYEKTQNGQATLNFDDLDLGHYSLKVFATDGEGMRHELGETFFCIFEDHDFMQYSWYDSPFGMNTSYYKPTEGWDPVTAGMIYLTGARNIRDGVGWRATETTPGEYKIFQPETIEEFRKYDMTQLYSVGYSNPLYDGGYTPWSDEGVQAFANYVKGVLDEYNSRYENYVTFVDVFNEYWAPKFGDSGNSQADSLPSSYYKMIQKTWETAKPGHSDALFGIVVGDAGDYKEWTEELCELGGLDYADYLQYHTYTRVPETDIKADAEFFKEMIARYGGGRDIPIYLDETGGHTASEANGLTFREQANLILRQHMVAFSNGIEKVYVYNFMNDGFVQSDNEDNFGIVHNKASAHGPFVPKEAYTAYGVMTRQLSGLHYMTSKQNEEIYHHVFGNGDRKVEVLYSLEDRAVTLLTDSPLKVTDMMGVVKTYEPFNGKVYLDLCKELLYVEGDFTLSDQEIPMQMYVHNAVVDSQTRFDFQPFGELADADIQGMVGKDCFEVADDYSFRAPTELLDKVYVIELMSDGKPFARLRTEVSFTEAYCLTADASFNAGMNGVDGVLTATLTNYADEPLYLDGIRYTMAEHEGTFEVNDFVEPLSSNTWTFDMPTVVPGKLYDTSLRIVRDGELSQRDDFTGRYQYNCLCRGQLPVGASTDAHKAKALHVEKKSFEVVKLSGVGMDDDKDISAELWISYDDNNLYIRAEVTDDVQRNTRSGASIYDGDCMQVGISTAQYAPNTQPKMYWELGFALTDSGPASWVWGNPIGAMAGPADSLVQGLEYRISQQKDNPVTIYELRIPWDGVAPFRPSRDDALKITVVFNEGDDSGMRDGWITWGKGLAESKSPALFNALEVID